MSEKKVKNFVKKRYGHLAKEGTSCCGPSSIDVGKAIGYTKKDLSGVPEAANMGLGCGNPVALASLRKGEVVLDLGSGAGLDVFLAAKKVGPKGKVIGVDMTEEMLAKARGLSEKYGYKNVEFRLGEIENLPLDDDSVDAVISNCVINLSVDKNRVFREAYRVLRRGGRLMVSDLVTEGVLPDKIKKSFEAWASCVAGALEKDVYLRAIKDVGFRDVRIVSESPYEICVSKELKGKITSVKVSALKPAMP